jgi:hypothetical protein
MNRRTVVVAPVVIVLTALGAGGCGESAEEKAESNVCDARASIASEVKSLGELTPTTVTADAVRGSVKSIRADLKTIRAEQADVRDERRADLKAANSAFTGSVREIAATVLRSQSVEEARTELTGAVDTLATSYRSTLGAFDCD